ncbi:MAG: DUF1553 domain-containing protein [Pedosphaera sp.]|nr:DUF1553 domain-containing protein [Pedosphaera sp.]
MQTHLFPPIATDFLHCVRGLRRLFWRTIICFCWVVVGEAVVGEESKRANEMHWAYRPIQRPILPQCGNPIDVLIGERLRAKGLTLNPPASPSTLMRRLSYDLTGLPPSTEEIEAFLKESPSRGYERSVDRLLASPRYGERWARHWLDVVRYTESQGFEYDHFRSSAWPYRDYVIDSFNKDKPYDLFMREQIAGDVMRPVTSERIIGASLLVSGPYDLAGNSQANATQKAITREEEMEDLVSVVGQTFLGLTVNCARCHDHKFDPIPTVDYYRVKAVFDGVKHGERSVEGDEESASRIARRVAWQRQVSEAEAVIRRIETEGLRRATLKRPVSTVVSVAGPVPMAHWTFDGAVTTVMPGEAKGGAKVENNRLQLPVAGAYFETRPLPREIREKTLEVWVSLLDLEQEGGAAISLESNEAGVFDALVFGERQRRKWMAGSEGFARTRDVDGPLEDAVVGGWVHMAAVYSADNRIALYRNGKPYGASYDPGVPLKVFPAGSARIVLGRRHATSGRVWLTGAVRQASLHDRALSVAEVEQSFKAGSGLIISQSELLAELDDRQRRQRLTALEKVARSREGVALESQSVPTVYAGTRQQPPVTRLLKRGDVKSPGDPVRPAGLSAIRTATSEFGLEAEAPEGMRRLKFAEWLADPSNPLPARVMANRVWQYHFGQGLVGTPSDFGRSGVAPSHPELLDWLASEFIASGWSVKALHRIILLSDTYRQSSAFRTEAAALDADAQLLWRFPPRRLEAEAVRDAMLLVSDQINLQVGGASFRSFTTTQYGATFYHLFDKEEPEYNRRTVYRMNISSGKEPLLEAFDCPDPSVKTPRRGVTTTPLQALGLMNGTFVQRQAEGLAQRSLRLAGNNVSQAVDKAWRLALGHPASPQELVRAQSAAGERGLVHVCWVLLNSTEFVYVQ